MQNNDFEILKSKAQSCRRFGCFLLSTAEISDFWIDINEFNSYQVVNSLINVSATFLKNFYTQFGAFSLVIPKYNNSSEKTFPIDVIFNSAIEKANLKEKVNKIYIFQIEESKDLIAARNIPCIIGIAVSIHITTLLKIIKILEKNEIMVSYVYTFLCRDAYSIKMLLNKNIALIPILYATSKYVYSINEISDLQDGEIDVVNLGIHKNLFEGEEL